MDNSVHVRACPGVHSLVAYPPAGGHAPYVSSRRVGRSGGAAEANGGEGRLQVTFRLVKRSARHPYERGHPAVQPPHESTAACTTVPPWRAPAPPAAAGHPPARRRGHAQHIKTRGVPSRPARPRRWRRPPGRRPPAARPPPTAPRRPTRPSRASGGQTPTLPTRRPRCLSASRAQWCGRGWPGRHAWCTRKTVRAGWWGEAERLEQRGNHKGEAQMEKQRHVGRGRTGGGSQAACQ